MSSKLTKNGKKSDKISLQKIHFSREEIFLEGEPLDDLNKFVKINPRETPNWFNSFVF